MRKCASMLALLLAPGVAPAQPAAHPGDVESIDAIVTAWYDIISVAPGEAVDWARDRWWIVGAAWRNETEEAPIPADYLP